jgi:hypothetical protein
VADFKTLKVLYRAWSNLLRRQCPVTYQKQLPIYPVADPEISEGGGAPERGPTPRKCKNIHVFWVSNLEFYYHFMVWLRYQRVISLKIQVGNTNQRNEWASTDPRINRRWDQVPRRSKHPLLIDHTRRELSSMIMNAELSAVKVNVSSTV